MGRVVDILEEARPDRAIRSFVAITKLPLDRDILIDLNTLFGNYFSPDFLTFFLSYSTYSFFTGPGTQQVNFMVKFCVKAGTVGLHSVIRTPKIQ